MSLSPPQNEPIIEGISVSPQNGGKIKSEVKNLGISDRLFCTKSIVKSESLFSNREC